MPAAQDAGTDADAVAHAGTERLSRAEPGRYPEPDTEAERRALTATRAGAYRAEVLYQWMTPSEVMKPISDPSALAPM